MKLKKLAIYGMTLTMGLSIFVGCGTKKDVQKDAYQSDNTQKVEQPLQTPTDQKPQQKVAVNFQGLIEEVDKEGNRIKIQGRWIRITDETTFADDPDNGIEPVSTDLSVGNYIVGYTADDLSKDEVTATAIYDNVTNMEQMPTVIDDTKPSGKVAVNISGEVQEVDKENNRIKIADQWVKITEETNFGDDPDNGVEPVSKDFQVGNLVTGYTQDDTSKEEVTAYAIYQNILPEK